MRSVSVGVALVTAAALGLSACSDSSNEPDPTSGEDEGPIVVGVVSPVTGANPVPVYQDGVKAAVEYINANGGVNGRDIEPVYCDDQGQDPAKNAACVRSFVSEGAVAILSYGSAMGTSIPIAESAGIAVINPASTTVEQDISNSIVLHADAQSGFSALFSYAQEQGASTAAGMVIGVPEVFELFGEQLLPAAAEKGGLEWVRAVPVEPTASDFAPPLLQASKDADVVVMAYGPAGMAQTVKTAKANGVGVQFGGTNTLIDQQNFLTPAGDSAEGVLAYAGVTPFTVTDDAEVKVFIDAMEAAGFGDEIAVLPQIGFSYMMTAYNVLNELDDISADTFLSYFQENPVEVFLGQTYDASKQPFESRPAIHVSAVRLMQVEDGTFVDATGEWADAYAG